MPWGACKTPRLNAKTFEKLIIHEIRENVLTESNIRDLVKLLDEEMDGVWLPSSARGWRPSRMSLRT